MTTKIPVELSSTPGIVDGSNATAITIDSSEDVTLSGHLLLADSKKVKLGAGSDLNLYHDGSDSYITDTGTGNLLIQYSDLYFSKDAGSSHMVRFHNSGDVTIGTTSASSAKLAVAGDVRVLDGNALMLRKTDTYINSPANDIMAFRTSGAERMRIASGGQVSVGGTAIMDGGRLNVIGNGADGLSIGSADSSNAYRHIYHTSSSGVLSFKSTGNTATLSNAGAWGDASDIAYKKDIVDTVYGLDTVKQFQPRDFVLKADETNQTGFIAQEMETVCPQFVVGEDGSKTINYGQITSVLTKAIQEQQTIIEDLKARIETLEG